MQCDLCGTEGELFLAEVEGTRLNVCKRCSDFGKIIRRVKSEIEVKKEKEADVKKIKKILFQEPEINETIVVDYAKRIKDAREKLGLKQEDFAKKVNEKESLVHHIETGKFEPSIGLARKLEKFLKIKLVEEYKEEKEPLSAKTKSDDYTIGDVIKIKYKDK